MRIDFTAPESGRREEGGYAVYPDALVFVAGDYPDKGFSLSAEELAAIPGGFSPVSGNVEHTSFLAGRACELRSVRVDTADPTKLRGEVAVPLWLDVNLQPGEKKLSAEWDRETKSLGGLALCCNPRIPEAQLLAAFANAHKTYEGQSVIQRMHDMAASSGAVCSKDASKRKFHSARELSGIQKMHDAAVEHGARCSVMTSGAAAPAYYSTPEPAMHKGFFKGLKAWFSAGMPDDFEIEPADPHPGNPPAPVPGPAPAPTPAPPAPAPAPHPAPAAAFADSPEARAMRDRIAELERNERRREAEAFADQLVRDGRLNPSARAMFAVQYARAAEDDARSPEKVTFTDDKGQAQQATRLDVLKNTYLALPKAPPAEELLGSGRLDVLFNAGSAKPSEKEEAEDKTSVDKFVKARQPAGSANGAAK